MNAWQKIRARFGKVCDWLDRSPLRYWTFHVCVSAAPSFVFMVRDTTGWPPVTGMLLGIGFFIALYTALAPITFPKAESAGLWRRAIRLGTKTRTGCSLLAIPGAATSDGNIFVYFFMPDMWAGMAAWSLTDAIGRLGPLRSLRIWLTSPDASVRHENVWVGDMGSVFPTFLTTVIEGFLLSGLLFLIAFVCLGALKLAARRKRALPA